MTASLGPGHYVSEGFLISFRKLTFLFMGIMYFIEPSELRAVR